ncbi:hypothetical protein E3N88_31390 [Mikania micrantha]|uniref:Uncharacterized protein n=1 Tax=Mikania micrantha TaxID=192012 RepID=A0A5N6MQ67_9ASTR|nr:hypothetical protein E3N88_31390 [Mikania micrantha]
MAAIVSIQSLKSDMAAGTPLMKAYSRLSVVNFVPYNASRQRYAVSPTPRAVSWGTGRGKYLLHPVNRLSLLPRPILKPSTHNQPVIPAVLCSIDPVGSTDSSIGIYTKFKINLKKWCDKQCLPIGAAVYILVEALQSAVYGLVLKLFVDRFVHYIPISELEQRKPYLGIYYPLLLSMTGSPFIVARSYAVVKYGGWFCYSSHVLIGCWHEESCYNTGWYHLCTPVWFNV